jgi:hypothetical protein
MAAQWDYQSLTCGRPTEYDERRARLCGRVSVRLLTSHSGKLALVRPAGKFSTDVERPQRRVDPDSSAACSLATTRPCPAVRISSEKFERANKPADVEQAKQNRPNPSHGKLHSEAYDFIYRLYFSFLLFASAQSDVHQRAPVAPRLIQRVPARRAFRRCRDSKINDIRVAETNG